MAEVNHPVFGRYDPELICECNHPRSYHNHMGLSENLIVGTNCNACRCPEFKEDKSVSRIQESIIRARKEIESRKNNVQAQLTLVENELIKLQESCKHPHKKSQPEYDFTAHWCDDCGSHWSTRR